MSKLEINDDNLKRTCIDKLDDTISKLETVESNIARLDIPSGFSYASYLKEIDYNLSSNIRELKEVNEKLQDISLSVRTTHDDMNYYVSRIQNEKVNLRNKKVKD